ncbi:hypothetical protein [Catenulispora sp. GAS73]|uniref:hypothetical protein n=1 Tax=Catenulispora sp. GAS73 TaxID=3156269 RepID=UPI0035155199
MDTPPNGWRQSAIHPRTLWPKEVRDFVPWLAANIGQLGAVLGRELTVVAREQVMWEATAIRPDLVAQTGDGDLVLIEAQLGRTDNRHLGQLLVYAAAGSGGASRTSTSSGRTPGSWGSPANSGSRSTATLWLPSSPRHSSRRTASRMTTPGESAPNPASADIPGTPPDAAVRNTS